MYDILSLFSVLHPHLSMTSLRQFSRVVFALLAMTGRVSMLNISRWTSEGGSYRTIQRFFNIVIPWGTVYWVFFQRICWILKALISSLATKQPCQNRGHLLMVYRVSSRLCLVKRYQV